MRRFTVLDLFDWRDTEPLDVGRDTPSIYHMAVLVDDPEAYGLGSPS